MKEQERQVKTAKTFTRQSRCKWYRLPVSSPPPSAGWCGNCWRCCSCSHRVKASVCDVYAVSVHPQSLQGRYAICTSGWEEGTVEVVKVTKRGKGCSVSLLTELHESTWRMKKQKCKWGLLGHDVTLNGAMYGSGCGRCWQQVDNK